MRHFGELIRNTWKVSKRGAGNGGEISWTDPVRNEELLRQGREEYLKNNLKKGRLPELVPYCVGTAF